MSPPVQSPSLTFEIFIQFFLPISVLLFSFRFLTILYQVFTQDLAWGKQMIIGILCIYVFAASFEWYFVYHIDSILPRRWAVLQSEIFCISYWLGLPIILCLSLLFLIIHRAPIITHTVVVLRWHIFLISISGSLYLLINIFECSSHQHELMGFHWSLSDSKSPQDFSQYSVRSQQYCNLHGLHSSSYYKVLQSRYQSFDDCTERTNYNWYHRHFHIP